jgi:hypothetical protein
MAKFIMTTFTNPVEGAEADFNKWYDEVHVWEMLALPGFVAAQRYELDPIVPRKVGSYLAVFEIETDDIDGLMGRMNEAAKTMNVSAALDTNTITMQVFKVLGSRRSS